MYGPLLLIVGCVFLAFAFLLFRHSADDRRRFRGAQRVTGEVVGILPGEPETARIQFGYQGKAFEVFYTPGTDDEGNQLALTLRVGDPVRLLVPPDRPQDAEPARKVRIDLYFGPAAAALLGTAALGFGLLLLTGSLTIAGPILAGVWIGGAGFVLYFHRK